MRWIALTLVLALAGCNSGSFDRPGLVIRSGLFVSEAAPRRLADGAEVWQLECFIGRDRCLDRAAQLCGGDYVEIRPANAATVPPLFDDFEVPNRVTVFARCKETETDP